MLARLFSILYERFTSAKAAGQLNEGSSSIPVSSLHPHPDLMRLPADSSIDLQQHLNSNGNAQSQLYYSSHMPEASASSSSSHASHPPSLSTASSVLLQQQHQQPLPSMQHPQDKMPTPHQPNDQVMHSQRASNSESKPPTEAATGGYSLPGPGDMSLDSNLPA